MTKVNKNKESIKKLAKRIEETVNEVNKELSIAFVGITVEQASGDVVVIRNCNNEITKHILIAAEEIIFSEDYQTEKIGKSKKEIN